MGKAGTYSDATGSPQTRCTTCRTIFEVSPELLSSSDTRVRCGECLSIFDALANLRDPGADEAPEDASDGQAVASDTPPRRPPDRQPVSSGKAPPADLAGASDAHGLADGEEVAALAELADETGSLDVTYSDFDLFSGDAQLPEVAYLDETVDPSDFDFGAVGLEEEETFSDALFAHDETIEPGTLGAGGARTAGAGAFANASSTTAMETDPYFLDDDGPIEPLVFEYRDGETRRAGRGAGVAGRGGASGAVGASTATAHDITVSEASLGGAAAAAALPGGAPLDDDVAEAALASGAGTTGYGLPLAERPGGSWRFTAFLLLVLLVLLGGLYAFRERDTLHDRALVRPVLIVACRALGCTVPSRVDLASLKLLDRKVYTHPTEAQALVINVAFRNDASFAQRYPVLVVRLRDRLGRIVAERAFAPTEYLDEWTAGDTLEAGRRLDISLEVDDPGDGAESYEFEFREASG